MRMESCPSKQRERETGERGRRKWSKCYHKISWLLHRWITTIESQLRDNDGLRLDLETKSDQLDRLREIDYDIVTRTYEIDKIQEFLETVDEERLDKVCEL